MSLNLRNRKKIYGLGGFLAYAGIAIMAIAIMTGVMMLGFGVGEPNIVSSVAFGGALAGGALSLVGFFMYIFVGKLEYIGYSPPTE